MRFQEALVTGRLKKYEDHSIEEMILTIRGQKVILDRDLAALYGVPTSRFNEAVKRNRRRFPDDFMFQLTRHEITDLISQNAISSSGHGGLRKLPRAFTEHGAIMAANIMHSDRAIQMSVRKSKQVRFWSGLGKGLGLLIDFNVGWLKEGIERLII
jgi:hypothetical protein